MQFFSVEWLEDGRICVEGGGGIMLQGAPSEVWPTLQQLCHRKSDAGQSTASRSAVPSRISQPGVSLASEPEYADVGQAAALIR